MDFIRITSKDNQLIKLVCALQTSAKARRENGLFVLEGLRICLDAYENLIEFDKLIVSKSAYLKYNENIMRFAQRAERCIMLTDELFKKICDTDSPQGIIALAKVPKQQDNIDYKGRYIALENLSDPSNLGAITRTAEALGVSGIILSSSGCDPYSPKSLRASMGTVLRVPIYITTDINRFIAQAGLRPFACVVDGTAASITSVNFTDGDVIMIGNEANGLSADAVDFAHMSITIPMHGRAESLNAASAASIAMWEMMKSGRN